MSDEIDPEIAALIGGDIQEYQSKGAKKPAPKGQPAPKGKAAPKDDAPDFDVLFGDMSVTGVVKQTREFEVDLTRKQFAEIKKFEEPKPAPFFNDPDYYKKVVSGEGEEATRFHAILTKYLQTTDVKDRSIFRQQLIPAYWNLLEKIARKVSSPQFAQQKQLVIRYGVILPTLLSPELRDSVSRIVYKKEIDEPVYYVDEWLKSVATGQVNASATDEVKAPKGQNDDRSRFNTLLQKAQGKRDTAEGLMKAKTEDRRQIEGLLKERVETICQHGNVPGLLYIQEPYTESQKKTMSETNELLKKLLAVDRELVQTIRDFTQAADDVDTIKEKVDGLGQDQRADFQALSQEFDAVRQMTKLSIGRQGNHFPILAKEYFHGSIKEMATRENVVKMLAQIESIDSEAFCRPYKNTLNRIPPYVILVPCYGDTGICWEPFDRFNRSTSRGRIAVPMFPKNLAIAVITAIADLRWQVAKEKASYYWMQEGLTGNYYNWFTEVKKIKGDVREAFIQDYILWITKESDGIQKLDKEVREIFWRFMPFSQPIKDKLKTRSYVYQDLCQKDVNRSLSAGY